MATEGREWGRMGVRNYEGQGSQRAVQPRRKQVIQVLTNFNKTL